MSKNILLIPHIQIQNANALSSPYTIGFPAMTAWMGAVHALQRNLKQIQEAKNPDCFNDLIFHSMAVISHDIDLQTYKGNGDYVHSIIGTGNPLDKNGDRSSFIEEARCHLKVSLVIEYSCEKDQELSEWVDQFINGKMKIAGGDILSSRPSQTLQINSLEKHNRLINQLMPGFCLIERRDLMLQSMQNGNDAMDALLDFQKINHRCQVDENEKVTWISQRKEKGWIVPIATGFYGVSELGKAENQRDPDTQHRFAESLVTLGEFKMPYRFENLDEILWHYHFDQENNLYLCQQNTYLESSNLNEKILDKNQSNYI